MMSDDGFGEADSPPSASRKQTCRDGIARDELSIAVATRLDMVASPSGTAPHQITPAAQR
jgi:hypothetical protein